MTTTTRGCQVSVCVAALIALPAVVLAQTYTATDLGLLPGHSYSVPTGINNRQQIVGVSGRPGATSFGEAWLWENGQLRALGIVADWWSLHINASGLVAGIRLVDGRREPFVWFQGTTYGLPNPPGDPITSIRALTDNNILMMCGARCWGLYAGAWYDLAALTGASIDAVNELGMLGGSDAQGGYLRYFDGSVARPSVPVDIIGPSGHFASASGRIGGTAGTHFTPDGVATDLYLFTIVGQRHHGSLAWRGMNRAGDLVGTYNAGFVEDSWTTSAIVVRNGRFSYLNDVTVGDLPWLSDARGINDAGQIVVSSHDPSYDRGHALLLTPAPTTSVPPGTRRSPVLGLSVRAHRHARMEQLFRRAGLHRRSGFRVRSPRSLQPVRGPGTAAVDSGAAGTLLRPCPRAKHGGDECAVE
jgi:uncharacterized membrane protein